MHDVVVHPFEVLETAADGTRLQINSLGAQRHHKTSTNIGQALVLPFGSFQVEDLLGALCWEPEGTLKYHVAADPGDSTERPKGTKLLRQLLRDLVEGHGEECSLIDVGGSDGNSRQSLLSDLCKLGLIEPLEQNQ